MQKKDDSIYPAPGVTGDKNKYSGERDYMIGRANGKGRVNQDANKTPNWSQTDTLETGLVSRQPL